MPIKNYVPTIVEPIEHARAKEALRKGVTVEDLLKLELAADRANGSVVYEIKDGKHNSNNYFDAQNRQKAIASNPSAKRLEEEGKAKFKENTLNTLNGVLSMSMPSTYYKLATGKDLTEGLALAMDLGTAFIGGLGVKASKGILNRILNPKIVKLKKVKPIESFVPLEEGYLYHKSNGSNIHPAGFNGKKFTYIQHEGTPGALELENGKYVTAKSRKNPYLTDYTWWDSNGHNSGKHVYVKKADGTEKNVLDNIERLDIGQYKGRYADSYYVIEGGVPADQVIHFIQDPISGTYVPHMPGKVLTNKQSISEIFNTPAIKNNNNLTKTSLAFYEKSGGKLNYTKFYK